MSCLPCAGPGCSSLGVGAFSENGPFRPSGNALVRNEYSWNRGIILKIWFQEQRDAMFFVQLNLVFL